MKFLIYNTPFFTIQNNNKLTTLLIDHEQLWYGLIGRPEIDTICFWKAIEFIHHSRVTFKENFLPKS